MQMDNLERQRRSERLRHEGAEAQRKVSCLTLSLSDSAGYFSYSAALRYLGRSLYICFSLACVRVWVSTRQPCAI